MLPVHNLCEFIYVLDSCACTYYGMPLHAGTPVPLALITKYGSIFVGTCGQLQGAFDVSRAALELTQA